MPADVRDVLYSTIDKIGREKIRMDVTANIDACEKYCRDILSECTRKLGPGADDETLATLCEALLHFMLAAAVLPSQRKVILQGIELDIVIPSLKMLNKYPVKSLVI